jgi:hypothetical protein
LKQGTVVGEWGTVVGSYFLLDGSVFWDEDCQIDTENGINLIMIFEWFVKSIAFLLYY